LYFRHVVLRSRDLLGRTGLGCARQLPFAGGIFEVSADRLLDLLAGVHEPENDEQRHHRGDEIGIGHLPSTSMVTAVTAPAFDDDGLSGCGHRIRPVRTPRSAQARPLIRLTAQPIPNQQPLPPPTAYSWFQTPGTRAARDPESLCVPSLSLAVATCPS